MGHLPQISRSIAVVAAAAALAACSPRTLPLDAKVSNLSTRDKVSNRGSLPPDITEILTAGGLDVANPAGPAEIPKSLGGPADAGATDEKRIITATGVEPTSSVSGVWQAPSAASGKDRPSDHAAPLAHPAGNVQFGEIDDLLPPLSKFQEAPRPPRLATRVTAPPKRKAAPSAALDRATATIRPSVRRF